MERTSSSMPFPPPLKSVVKTRKNIIYIIELTCPSKACCAFVSSADSSSSKKLFIPMLPTSPPIFPPKLEIAPVILAPRPEIQPPKDEIAVDMAPNIPVIVFGMSPSVIRSLVTSLTIGINTKYRFNIIRTEYAANILSISSFVHFPNLAPSSIGIVAQTAGNIKKSRTTSYILLIKPQIVVQSIVVTRAVEKMSKNGFIALIR